MRRYLSLALAYLGLAFTGGCYVGVPFRGPGWDAQRGVTVDAPNDTVLVAITHGERTPGEGGAFRRELRAVLAELPEQPGLIGSSARAALFGNEIWTLSAWRDEDALDAFVASPVHRHAARSGGVERRSVVSVVLELPADELPLSWARAERLFEERRAAAEEDF